MFNPFIITSAYAESLNRLIMLVVDTPLKPLEQRFYSRNTNVKLKEKKKFKKVVVTFGKMLSDQLPNWAQSGYEWVYEEIYGADFSILTKAIEECSF